MVFLGAAEFAPFLLVGLLAGVWVDRLSRRLILIGVLAIDTVSFLLSALWLSQIRSPKPVLEPSQRQNVLKEIGDGLRLVLRNPLLRSIAGSSVWVFFSLLTCPSGATNFFSSYFGVR